MKEKGRAEMDLEAYPAAPLNDVHLHMVEMSESQMISIARRNRMMDLTAAFVSVDHCSLGDNPRQTAGICRSAMQTIFSYASRVGHEKFQN